MTSPRIVAVDVDWNAARAAFASFDQQQPAAGEAADAAPADALVRLNDATAKIFPKAAASGVPVLLPFDTAAFLRDRAQSTAGDDNAHVSGFRAPTFFYPGPSGYDAAFLLPPEDQGDLHLTFAKPVNVQMTGSAVIYELDGPAADQSSPVPDLERDFPGIRRVLLENRLRYIFTRFGVPYFVSIACFDGAGSTRRLSCREADHVAVRFLKTLNLVGGAPQTETAKTALATIEQPEQTSPDFTYYAPGDILPGTGMHGHSGKPDTTVYSKIRFPMAHAPAYTNSQSFGSWGNCDLTGRVSLGGRGREAAYRCRVNAVPLFNDETKNYTYPWRDNFCEHRHWSVSQCPAGLGHQGEDIRPSSCKLRNEGADRCEPYQDQVVAVRDGVAWRETGDEALYLTTDTPGEHIRFRYLHMNPHMLDFAGMVSGHEVAEGEVLGPVGDYGKREGGTTYHLHFDMQVLTRQGWVFVNPYMTLVAAYERLIGGRGQVVAAPALSRPILPARPIRRRQMVWWRPPSAPSESASTPTRARSRVNADNPSAGPSPHIARRTSLKAIAAAFAGLMLPSSLLLKSAGAENSPTPFDQWIAGFRAKALARGITPETYTRVMSAVRPDPAGLEALRDQPEFNEQLWQYLNRRVSDWRIITGTAKAKEYAPLFARIERDYGVEPAVMLGVWGVEFDLRRSAGAEEPHAAGHSLAGDAGMGRAAAAQILGNRADQRADHHSAGLEHAGGNGRLVGGRHGPHPMDARSLAPCRPRL